MSHSPLTEEQTGSAEYVKGWVTVMRMVRSGDSWSGLERNCAFLNTGARRFADISAVTGLDFAEDARGAAVADWDHDGDLDLWVSNRTSPRVRFMRNDATEGRPFVAVRLRGVADNRDGIGARVRVTPGAAAAGPLIRTLRAGEGFVSQSSKWLHFGLGGASGVERVEVDWPNGDKQVFRNIEPNRRYLLTQGAESAEAWTPPRGKVSLAASTVERHTSTGKARIVLASRPPMPTLDYQDFDGNTVNLADRTGRPYLLNLWAVWCQACVQELTEFAAHREEFEKAGLDVLTFNADPPEGLEDAREFLESLDGGFEQGVADEETCDILDMVQKTLLDKRERIPLPTSFLVDAQGRMVAIYKGPVAVAELLDDVKLLQMNPAELRAEAVPFDGRWYVNPPQAAVAELAEALNLLDRPDLAEELLARGQPPQGAVAAQVAYDLGLRLRRQGKEQEARAAFERSAAGFARMVDAKPTDAVALNNFGAALQAAGRPAESLEPFRRALDGHPAPSHVHANMARSMAMLGRHQEAADHYREAIAGQPDEPSLQLGLGRALFQAGRRDEGRAELERLLERRPRHAEALYMSGIMALQSGDLTVAGDRLNILQEVNPTMAARLESEIGKAR